jgi:hypothetical protein
MEMQMLTDQTKKIAADLAMSMGVSVSDLMCLARSVSNSIQQDRVESAFLNASNSDQVKIASAYVPVAVKKHQAFVAAYLTRPADRSAFDREVFRLVRLNGRAA